ncbi:MAG TPA: hypothetical protein VK801_08315, partial [Caulobacteraceae bacterium]|nr:hypothetical protein [Caulobacteraceae bacterium]
MRPHALALLLIALGATLCSRCPAEEAALGPDAASVAIAELSAANAARSALAREHDAWQTERERLRAVQDAEDAERARLHRELALAQAGCNQARAEVAAAVGADEAAAVQARIAAAVPPLVARLAELRARLPPGAVAAVPEGAGVDEVIRAIDESERDAATASIELVAGSLDGAETAVKLLRVSGC